MFSSASSAFLRGKAVYVLSARHADEQLVTEACRMRDGRAFV